MPNDDGWSEGGRHRVGYERSRLRCPDLALKGAIDRRDAHIERLEASVEQLWIGLQAANLRSERIVEELSAAIEDAEHWHAVADMLDDLYNKFLEALK